MRRPTVLPALFALLVPPFLAASPTPALAAWSHSPASGVNVSQVLEDQDNAVVCEDGSGGVIVAWSDTRDDAVSAHDIWAQRLDRAGRPQWGTGGVLVCAEANGQFPVDIVPDGAGGAIVVWTDQRAFATNATDIYASRLSASGARLWGTSGVAVSAVAGDQGATQQVAVAADGAGGVVVAWVDTRNAATSTDIYGQWLTAAGANRWTANGRAICTASGSQFQVSVAVRPGGDMVAAWMDQRNLATTGADIYAQKMSSTGTTRWAAQGVPACNATSDQTEPFVSFRLNGDVFVAFSDGRGGTNASDIYMSCLRALDGTHLFVTNGWAVCTAAQEQRRPRLVSDETGAVIVLWDDRRAFTSLGYDLFAQRYAYPNQASWAANGVVVCSEFGDQTLIDAIPDGVGGAIAVWYDARNGGTELFGQRVKADGTRAWPAGGVAIARNPSATPSSPHVARDGRGGAILTFDLSDPAFTFDTDVLAHRVDEWGVLGGEPVLTSVEDLPNDEGGLVRVSWLASPVDTDPAMREVTDYLVFRSATSSAVLAKRANEGLRGPSDLHRLAIGDVLERTIGGRAEYWEMVGTHPALHLPAYALSVPTPGDSVAGSNPWSAFLVMARDGTTRWWTSEPESGYSVDNLAPPTPSPFTGSFQGGSAYLSWGASGAADLAAYRIHRGASPSFEPSPANLVGTTTEQAWTDPAGIPAAYKLVAVDVHGNASAPATLVPDGVLDAPRAAAVRTGLRGVSPGPLVAGRAATIAFGLGRDGHVKLELFDVAGRRVVLLLDEPRPAGEHRVAWNGHDEGGTQLRGGVYLLRFESDRTLEHRRIVIVP